MTRSSKLYSHITENPQAALSFRDFEALLAAFGFTCDRIVGSHRQYVHPDVPRTIPVQPDGKDAKRYQVRQFLDMVHAYNLSMS